MLDLCREIVTTSEEGCLASKHCKETGMEDATVLAVDDSVLGSLCLVATRCENLHLRQEAIRIMKQYPRKEGVWDSITTAGISEWLMEDRRKVEEETPFVDTENFLAVNTEEAYFTEKVRQRYCLENWAGYGGSVIGDLLVQIHVR
ncbi:hypothetical protein B0J14DRAFT_61595 [Halenospora varia]|nr:hypothetical protein B0J14DRAFT_61595 [Halenospora varia]